MQPQFNDEGFVPVVVPGALVLLPLPGLQLELLLYTAHATRNRRAQDTGESPPQLTTLREPVHTPTHQVWPLLAPSQQSLIPFSRDS